MRPFGQQERLGVQNRLTFLAECRWEGVLYDLGEYPGAVPGTGTVHGELFRLRDPRVLELLDRYEGFDPNCEAESLFVRRPVHLRDPTDCTAWMYVYNRPITDHQRVPSGDWASYVRTEKQS